jgi:3-oxoacyl-[acyl-carrier-protein] synthase I
MRRVVITGMGIVSSIGNTVTEVEAALRAGKSGIVFAPDYAEHGFRCHVHGQPNITFEDHIADSGLTDADISNDRTGLIMGSGGPSTKAFFRAHNIVRESGGPKRIGPFSVTKGMSSTTSACLATPFKIKGVNYSITSACSTSAHCIGNGTELIQMGKQDIVFAGGGEELDWTLSCLFDAMTAMSSKYNDAPATASRTYDATRDGFVIAGGGGVVVLEELNHALARGAKIYGEVTGYGATSDGHDMVAPSGEGGERAMRLALSTLPKGRKVDYINSHGTSTQVGDVTEVEAIRRVFGRGKTPPIASTKSLTGHALGGAGVWEAIYSLIMMNKGFIAASANITTLDPALDPGEIVQELRTGVDIDSVLSNSFGFGGTNATLVMSKLQN